MEYKRADRVGDLIHREIATMLLRDIKDPRIGMVTLSRVVVTSDLHHAKVYYTVVGDEAQRKATDAALRRAAGYLRRQLGQVLHMRTTPELIFVFDNSLDHVERMAVLFHEIERREKSGLSPADVVLDGAVPAELDDADESSDDDGLEDDDELDEEDDDELDEDEDELEDEDEDDDDGTSGRK